MPIQRTDGTRIEFGPVRSVALGADCGQTRLDLEHTPERIEHIAAAVPFVASGRSVSAASARVDALSHHG